MESVLKLLNFQPKIIGIVPRPRVGPGLLLLFLLPLAILASTLDKNRKSDHYELYSVYTCHSLLNGCMLIIHGFSKTPFNLKKDVYFFSVAPALTTFFAYITLLNLDTSKSLCYVVANTLIYAEGIQVLFKAFPRTFTFGEANIVIQGISFFLFSLVLKLNTIITHGPYENEIDISTCVLQLSVFWIIIFCVVPYGVTSFRSVVPMYSWTLSIVTAIYFTVFNILKIDLIFWIVKFITKPERLSLLISWFACSVFAVVAVLLQISSRKKSNTMNRKIFHAIISIVFLTGILFDFNFIYFSSGCVFCLFIILEVFRIVKLPPLDNFLKEGFLVFCDEKDSGGFALTPISLLVGTALPLWLFPSAKVVSKSYLLLLSGVLSVGIGDTFASVGGKLLGRHKWPGSFKTIEGTVFCILSQIAFLASLNYFGFLRITSYPYLAIIITSLVEAFTDQIDNIVLPLVMYTTISWVSLI